jgi:hypothetical protein
MAGYTPWLRHVCTILLHLPQWHAGYIPGFRHALRTQQKHTVRLYFLNWKRFNDTAITHGYMPWLRHSFYKTQITLGLYSLTETYFTILL